jgi:hypothetical protein
MSIRFKKVEGGQLCVDAPIFVGDRPRRTSYDDGGLCWWPLSIADVWVGSFRLLREVKLASSLFRDIYSALREKKMLPLLNDALAGDRVSVSAVADAIEEDGRFPEIARSPRRASQNAFPARRGATPLRLSWREKSAA